MALSPEEANGGESTASDAPRTLPTPFLTKTYQLVDDRSIDDVISWNEDGSTFVVWNTTEFSRDLLPQYFKHNNFSSFVRQLNTYGFRKVVPDRWEFSHECFRRGEKRLLHEIKRRKVASPAAAATEPGTATETDATVPAAPEPAPPTRSSSYSEEEQVISSNSWPATAMAMAPSLGSTTELIDENEKLRRENLKLNRELSQMKNLCGNIYALMSNYASNRAEGCSQAAKPLHLLPLMRFFEESDVAGGGDNHLKTVGGNSVRMFEVSAKRAREGEGEAAEQRLELQLQLGGVEVKSEPLDRRNGVDDHEISWLRLRESY